MRVGILGGGQLGVMLSDAVGRLGARPRVYDPDPEAPARRRNGVGLANVRQRLQARYGNRATFEAKGEGDRFRVAITLPAGKPSEKEVAVQ